MKQSLLLAYLDAFHRIEGWFDYDAALMFMAYNQILASHGVAGDVLEIGVHHGLSSIAVASLRGSGARLYAVDLFEGLQDLNLSHSGAGNRKTFEKNMRSFFGDIGFIRTLTRASRDLTPADLGQSLSFCHIDGGHSRQETFSDLHLCYQAMVPGGIVALDDYFNVEFPGVCEGAIEFMLKHPGALQPLAVGFHKVLFQKQPVSFDTNAELLQAFPYIERRAVQLWDRPTILFTVPLRHYFDLQASTPDKFYKFGSVPARASVLPARTTLQAVEGERLTLPVTITNTSSEKFPCGDRVFGLSYHLYSGAGECLRYDNERAYLKNAVAPGETVSCDLAIDVPREKGAYRLELDLVWEGVIWFQGIGNPTVSVDLVAS
jgi:hypothetical protein